MAGRVRIVSALAACLWPWMAFADDTGPRPCRVEGHRHEVLCGQVTRPLDPSRPAGPSIDVHYVVVPAMARRKLPDPVFFIAGGPGQSATQVMAQVHPLLQRLNGRRDLVFVDQRGTGRSLPLACADTAGRALGDDADPQRQLQEVLACRDRLAALPALGGAQGLAFFTTPIAMQDLDAVRRSLGAPRINLLGASYGTRAALDYLRQFPQHVRRVVLDGVAPPDMALPASQSIDSQRAFDALLQACRTEPACAADFPDLRGDWDRLLASLPRPVTVAHPLTGLPQATTLTRDAVLAATRGALYSPVLASALPAALHAASKGRAEGLAGLAGLMSSGKATALATGMHFSVICAEDMPRLSRRPDAAPGLAEGGRDFGTTQRALYDRVCAEWPRGTLPPAFYTVPPSPVPVLLLSGGLDPATPPRHGERVAQALGAKARHLVVDNAGHGLMSLGCLHDAWTRFLDEPDEARALAINADCTKAVPRPPAWRPPRLRPEAAS